MQLGIGGGEHTDHALGLLVASYPVGEGFPLHIHHKEHEAHYILEGRMLFEVDGERFEVGNLEELKGYLAAGRTNEKYDLEIVGPMPQQGEHHGQR
jgi:hypothetical protein